MRIPRAGVLAIQFCIYWGCLDGWAQTNSWTNAASGNWEDNNWSLGTLPGTNQNIMRTNAGWKAVSIGPTTVRNFPQSLNIQSLTISSPTDSANQLLMNYAGTPSPLVIGSDSPHGIFFVESNASFTMLSSALTVNLEQASIFSPFDSPGAYGAFSVGGTFNESDGSQVTANFLKVGDIGPGTFNLTNSTLNVPYYEILGGYASTFNQYGGTNTTAALVLTNSGEYNLYDGALLLQNSGSSEQYDGQYDLNITFSGGNFNQWGGTVSAGLMFQSGGSYQLSGGTLNVNNLGGVAMLQTGGTNFINFIGMTGGGASGRVGGYTLQDGYLNSGSVNVGMWQGTGAGQLVPYKFPQAGGTHITHSLNVAGAYGYGYAILRASYDLMGGTLAADNMILSMGAFNQTAGSSQVGTLELDNISSCNLSGGLLTAQNIQCNGGSLYNQVSWFTQSGGTNVTGNISLNNSANYLLSNGQLTAQNVQVTENSTVQHTGGTLNVPGVITLSEGNWNEQAASAQLGQLQLSGGGNSGISLSSEPCVLQFADSSSLTWSNNATLTINNWQGSLFGGGTQQVIFGNSASALTSAQLALVQFYNPAGLAAGHYPARILSNGEIVPNAGGTMMSLTTNPHTGYEVKLLGKAGMNYEIDISPDFVHWTPWTNQVANGGMICICDPDATNHPMRFYRAVIRQ